jgi:tetratricopeptide (TPR) repeat protein
MRQVQSEARRAAPAGAAGLRLFGWGWPVLLLAAGLMVSSCKDENNNKGGGGGGPTGPVYTAAELNEMGWTSFATGDYYDAWSYFSQSVAKDAALYEAYLGLGWAQAYTGLHADAATTFQDLIAGGHLTNDAHAGLAAAVLSSSPQEAEAAAEAVLTADPDYVFSRRTTFDHSDLMIILAEAYFMEQRYNLAQVTAETVGQAEGVPPSGLDPVHSETWVVDGVTYGTYPAALAAVIQNLSLLLATHVPG